MEVCGAVVRAAVCGAGAEGRREGGGAGEGRGEGAKVRWCCRGHEARLALEGLNVKERQEYEDSMGRIGDGGLRRLTETFLSLAIANALKSAQGWRPS